MSLFAENFKEQSSTFLRPKEGTITFRIVSPIYSYYSYWNNDKEEIRSLEAPVEMINPKLSEKTGEPEKAKYNWAFLAVDAADGNVKITTIGQVGIRNNLQALFDNPGWGEQTQNYNISITRSGSGLTSKYQVVPSPAKDTSLPAAVSLFDMDAFCAGGDAQ